MSGPGGAHSPMPPAPDAPPRQGLRWCVERSPARRAVLAALAVVVATSALAGSAVSSTSMQTPPSSSTPTVLQPVGVLVRKGVLPAPALSGDVGPIGLPNGLPPASAISADLSANNHVSALYQGAAGTLTPAGIATLAIQGGCAPTQAVTATAIAMAESGGSPSAQGDIALMDAVWDWSAGLWQIRGLRVQRMTGALRDSVANQEPVHNTSAMFVISQQCTSWGPWSTYTNGAYEQFLAMAQQAVNYVVSYYNAHGGAYPTVAAPDPTTAIPVRSTGTGTGAGAATSATSGGTATAASSPAPSPTAAAPPQSQRTQPVEPPAPRPTPASTPPPASRPAQPVAPTTPGVQPPVTVPPLPAPSLPLPSLPTSVLPNGL